MRRIYTWAAATKLQEIGGRESLELLVVLDADEEAASVLPHALLVRDLVPQEDSCYTSSQC